MRRTSIAGPLALLAAALTAAGCGSSSSNTDSSSTSAGAPTPARPVSAGAVDASNGTADITAKDLSFDTSEVKAKAGKLKVTLDNKGQAPHEFVVLKTNAAPDSLKTTGGKVDEAHSVGEVSETAGGSTKTGTIHLKPGHYVFVCNLPGHYASGMHGEIVVK